MIQHIRISRQLLFVNKILFVFSLFGLIGAPHTNTIRAKRYFFPLFIAIDGSFTEVKVNEWKGAASNRNQEEDGSAFLVKILKNLGSDLVDSVEYGDDELTQILLSEIKDVWRRIVNSPKSLVNSGETPESLGIYMAKILFIAKDRHCESPDETYFNGQCLPISTKKRSEHCPEHMGLYDDEKNEGICDCLELTREQAKSQLRPIYSNETGVCHLQNTQGPCENGEWFVLKNTYPRCEPVPHGCPTDGRHVYWNPDNSTAKECWEIWTQGPCDKGQLLHLEQDTEELQLYCSFRLCFSVRDRFFPQTVWCMHTRFLWLNK
ncbi:uncharacterized protein LOC124197754 isoform X3 [Daphnia pulex]|uniref:uncharacterized protein LOC124197754 isoform X3 n=1 Tax=Daphnia pulex TaxID=6669 RepID=UPI001EDD150B|nr:uncharacterized protein LOC124197754 isoform X3 [Daphnia pulex]